MIDPEDLAAFQAAVADIKPLPPPNRVQLSKPKPAFSLRQQSREKDQPTPKKPKKQLWPAHWHAGADPATPALPLNPELAALQRAMAGVEPLPPSNRVVLGRPLPPSRPQQFIADERAALHESLHGPIALQDRLEGGDEACYLRQGLASNVLRDLRRGRWVVQEQLDLHGLNREEARHQLASFLAACLHQGKRCVRIIHGKGHGSPQKLSILRQLVRGWLAQRIEVLAYCQAPAHDGGDGAVIALLRAPK